MTSSSRWLHLLGVWVLCVACGGGGDDAAGDDAGVADASVADGGIPDAAVMCPDPAVGVDAGGCLGSPAPTDPATNTTAVCNPVAQTGCAVGEKCATLIESDSPFLARTTCVPDGTEPLDCGCARGAVGATGYDNCQAGLACTAGTCSEICSTSPNTCTDGACTLQSGLFDDVGAGDVGVCSPSCDAVAQDCTEDDACYFNFTAQAGVCAGVPADAESGVQDQPCLGPAAGQCFLNGCAEGYGASVPASRDPGAEFLCAKFCTPAFTDKDNTDDPAGIENPNAGQYSCASPCGPAVGPDTVPNENYQCRFFNSFFGDTDTVPDTIGFCVNKAVWGDCLLQDTAGCVADIDNFDPANPGNHPCATVEPGCVPVSAFQ